MKSARFAALAVAATCGCSSGFGISVDVDSGCAASAGNFAIAVTLNPSGRTTRQLVPKSSLHAGHLIVYVVPPADTNEVVVSASALDGAGREIARGDAKVAVGSRGLTSASIVLSGCAGDAGVPDLGGDAGAITDGAGGDLAGCTAVSCQATPEAPYCDFTSGACVACQVDGHCPDGKLCVAHACVPGCSLTKGCGDAGLCESDAGQCHACASDSDCSGQLSRCDKTTGRCAVCAPLGNDCPPAWVCTRILGNLQCVRGCMKDAECSAGKPDGSVNTQVCCSGLCVDPASDAQNCGACGKACGGGSACCASACMDVSGDPMHCGGCATVCNLPHATPACAASMCAIAACATGWADCNHSAMDGCETNTASDLANCGGCGLLCSVQNATETCTAGACAIASCAQGFSDCNHQYGDGCEANLGADPKNCGACGSACSVQNGVPGCTAGACSVASCTPGFSDCNMNAVDGCETDTGNDLKNCGACGNVCNPMKGGPLCASGQCTIACSAPFKDCDGNPQNGCEANLNADPKNCGGCGHACTTPNAVPGCLSGACSIAACNPGFADCDLSAQNGCEVAITADVMNCGACGKVCAAQNAIPSCALGACGIAACTSMFADCNKLVSDGCEVNLANDPQNCKTCGNLCTVPNATPACALGQCGVGVCSPGFADCNKLPADGCEVNLVTDVRHCGKCQIACNHSSLCVSGLCKPKIMLVASDNAKYRADVALGLLGTNLFSSVDTFDAAAGTPEAAALGNFDAVLVWSAGPFANGAALGDVLAAYIDTGGRVVAAMSAENDLGGAFAAGYQLIQPSMVAIGAADQLGVIDDPNSPIIAGVKSLAILAAPQGLGTPQNGGVAVAHWASGRTLAMRGQVKGKNRVDLNLYPVSGTIVAGSWTGDGFRLLANALLYQ